MAIAVATHDQGVVAVLRPDGSAGFSTDELDTEADTIVHEIELGDLFELGLFVLFYWLFPSLRRRKKSIEDMELYDDWARANLLHKEDLTYRELRCLLEVDHGVTSGTTRCSAGSRLCRRGNLLCLRGARPQLLSLSRRPSTS